MNTNAHLRYIKRIVSAALVALPFLILATQPSNAHGSQPAPRHTVDTGHQERTAGSANNSAQDCDIEMQCHEGTQHDHNTSSSCCCDQMCHSAVMVMPTSLPPYIKPNTQAEGPATPLSSAPSDRIYHPPRRAAIA